MSKGAFKLGMAFSDEKRNNNSNTRNRKSKRVDHWIGNQIHNMAKATQRLIDSDSRDEDMVKKKLIDEQKLVIEMRNKNYDR
jgi:hypothetical protein